MLPTTTQAANVAALLVGVGWYALVLYKTWPVCLTFWPLLVLAYCIVQVCRGQAAPEESSGTSFPAARLTEKFVRPVRHHAR